MTKKATKSTPVKQANSRLGNLKNTKATRFKKGVSGNPNGRPKKADCLTDIMREKLAEAVVGNLTRAELVVVATIELAMKGNAAALKEVWERMDGKVKDKLELDDKTTPNAVLLAEILTRKELKELDERITKPIDD